MAGTQDYKKLYEEHNAQMIDLVQLNGRECFYLIGLGNGVYDFGATRDPRYRLRSITVLTNLTAALLTTAR